MYPIQNVNNDPTGNLGYHKLIIVQGGPQQNVQLVQKQPNNNYPIIQQQLNYLPQHQQQPPQQPYHQAIQQPYFQFQQPFQPQQPIFNPQFNQVVPNMQQLNNYDHLKNQGQNKRFGVCISLIWAITSFLDLIVAIIGQFIPIPQEFCILCIIVMLLFTLTAFIINQKQTTVVSVVLFQLFILSNFGASLGFYQLLDIDIKLFHLLYLVFQYHQIVTMTAASMYLLYTRSMPEARYILRITIVQLFITLTYHIYLMIDYSRLEQLLLSLTTHILIWFVCCSLSSQYFVKILNQVYAGQNKRISKENIWTGFILFKLYFYIPCL